MGSSQQDCNTQNLYENLKQREGESYRELVQRIQDTLKGYQVEGLLSKKALEGHILFKAKFGGNNCMGSSQQDCNTQNLYENLQQREGESYR